MPKTKLLVAPGAARKVEELTHEMKRYLWNILAGQLECKDRSKNCKGICDQYCNPETNKRGLRLLEFASYHNLNMVNTSGPHKPSRHWTWRRPGGEYHNQINYIMVERFQSCVNFTKTRSFPGPNIRSDHELEMMTFKLRLQTMKRAGQHKNQVQS